jgi:hypothetical protein
MRWAKVKGMEVVGPSGFPSFLRASRVKGNLRVGETGQQQPTQDPGSKSEPGAPSVFFSASVEWKETITGPHAER